LRESRSPHSDPATARRSLQTGWVIPLLSIKSYELSYATPRDSLLRRYFMRAIEDLSGRRRLLPLYYRWRSEIAGKSPCMWGEMLDMAGTPLEVRAPAGWTARSYDAPLVMIANHPYGLADGIAMLALAERLGRPYRILLHTDLMRIPEIQPLALPVAFAETRGALATNLRTRAEARRLLKEGTTIVIFPAGGVATADGPFGIAEELPWKQFVVRLIRQSQASVLPVHFEGQNSPLFHFVSRYSETLRLSLLVCEFGRKVGRTIRATVSTPVSYADLIAGAGERPLIDELYLLVHRLAPGADRIDPSALLPRPLSQRRRFPWDEPAERPSAKAETVGQRIY
jgi:putative hemolysin